MVYQVNCSSVQTASSHPLPPWLPQTSPLYEWMCSRFCTVRSPQGLECTAATKQVTSGLYPASGRPQENLQAVLNNCWGTFVPGDPLSISFIGIALHCRTVKAEWKSLGWSYLKYAVQLISVLLLTAWMYRRGSSSNFMPSPSCLH